MPERWPGGRIHPIVDGGAAWKEPRLMRLFLLLLLAKRQVMVALQRHNHLCRVPRASCLIQLSCPRDGLLVFILSVRDAAEDHL